MARRTVVCTLALGSIAAFALLCGGCASSTDHASVRTDPSPEMHTLHQRYGDAQNMVSITFNENLRAMNSDLARFFLLSRPSLLTPEPIPR